MKKYLALLLAAIMALSLAACASTSKTEETASAKLTMATEATFPPYEYYDGDAIVGIDVEVAQAIAEKLGMELEVTDIAFDSIIPGIQTGKYDMGMAGMTVTDERKEQVNFSDSYATGVQVVIVKDDSPITSVDDLFADFKQQLIKKINENVKNGEQATDMLMVAKYFERIGDHATNIAEWVIYSITGEHEK